MARYRFYVFRWIDFLTFGMATILSTVLSCWASLTPGNPIVGLVISWAASVGFSFVYAMILGRRLAFERDIAYVTIHGLVVMRSEWIAQRLRVERETERVFKLWETAIDNHLDDQDNARAGRPPGTLASKGRGLQIVRPTITGVVLRWAKAPFTLHIRPAFKWMGLTSGSGRSMMVGHVEPLDRSAFGHEIGHAILIHWLGDGTEETLKRFHDKYATPY